MKIYLLAKKILPLSVFVGVGLLGTVSVTYAVGNNTTKQQGVSEGQNIKKSPTFQLVDKNGDHYVTKAELEGYPFLLKHFDKVDAGEDGRLEEHEYENLLMEKEREKGQ